MLKITKRLENVKVQIVDEQGKATRTVKIICKDTGKADTLSAKLKTFANQWDALDYAEFEVGQYGRIAD